MNMEQLRVRASARLAKSRSAALLEIGPKDRPRAAIVAM